MLNYSAAVDYSKIITIEPGKRSGKPCIRGMRITVQDVFERELKVILLATSEWMWNTNTPTTRGAPIIPNSVSEAPIAAAYSSIQFTSARSSFDGNLSIAASISVTVLTSAIYPASQTSASFEPQYVRTLAPVLETFHGRREEASRVGKGRGGEQRPNS